MAQEQDRQLPTLTWNERLRFMRASDRVDFHALVAELAGIAMIITGGSLLLSRCVDSGALDNIGQDSQEEPAPERPDPSRGVGQNVAQIGGGIGAIIGGFGVFKHGTALSSTARVYWRIGYPDQAPAKKEDQTDSEGAGEEPGVDPDQEV